MGDYSAFHTLLMTCMESGDYACAKALLRDLPEEAGEGAAGKLKGLFSEKLFGPTDSKDVREGRCAILRHFIEKDILNPFVPLFWGGKSPVAFLVKRSFDLFAIYVTRILIDGCKGDYPDDVAHLSIAMLPFDEVKNLIASHQNGPFANECARRSKIDTAQKVRLVEQLRLKKSFDDMRKKAETECNERIENIKKHFEERKRALDLEEAEATKKLKGE